MHKKQSIVTLVVLLLAVAVSGCALINTALSAGIAYGIYQATRSK